MPTIKEALAQRIPDRRQEISDLVRNYGDRVIDEVTVKQAYGGMRGVKGLVCDTSLVDPEKGLIIRGTPINQLADCTAEEIFFLLVVGDLPTQEEHKTLRQNLLARSEIPEYVWNVLRVTDPRFTAFNEFGRTHFPNDPVFETVDIGFQVIPKVLREHGKAASPWPNVDAGSGALLHHYGITEMSYYTVIFSVSRAMGICAQLVTSRAMMEPIIRPKSVSTSWVREELGMSEAAAV
jgi:citrate synthase